MIYYKKPSGEVFAYNSAAERARWGAPDLVAMTQAEVAAHIAPPPPPPSVPQAVSRFQARAALHLAGLLEQVETMMANPATDPMARLAWQDAQEFRRNSPTVLGMGAALGLSQAQLDDLFIQAATISA